MSFIVASVAAYLIFFVIPKVSADSAKLLSASTLGLELSLEAILDKL